MFMEMLLTGYLANSQSIPSSWSLNKYHSIQLVLKMKYLIFVFTALCCITAITTSSGNRCEAAETEVQRTKHRIDTHIHLYDTRRNIEITWPPENDKILYQPHLPDEYSKLAKAAGVTGVVVVEASLRYPDNRWVLDLVEDDDFYVGLVGNIDVTGKDFKKKLTAQKEDSRFVGIRPRNRDSIDFTDKRVLRNLKILADSNLTMDYLTNGGGIDGLKIIEEVARKIPHLKIVVNHCLGYNFDGEAPSDDWISMVKQLASHPNVSCKISGLYQRSTEQPAPKQIAYYQDVLSIIWDSFGTDRIVYGSNWPVTKHSGSYQSYVDLVDQFISSKGQEARENYYWRNASKIYNLGIK